MSWKPFIVTLSLTQGLFTTSEEFNVDTETSSV